MSQFDYQRSLYLSPDQQDLLLAALSSADPATRNLKNTGTNKSSSSPSLDMQSSPHNTNYSGLPSVSTADLFASPIQDAPGSGQLGFEDSPFLDFDLDVDFDPNAVDLIGDLPNGDDTGSREKRKSLDTVATNEENGKKRRESSDDKSAKKPGRKPLTSEPTTKRKAQNRAAQRAFRERKEKHLHDLETKVEELEKRSNSTNHENNLLRAQVERLQVELREYRKRLSWINSGNSISPTSSLATRNLDFKNNTLLNNEFSFEFPKFGDLPRAHASSIPALAKQQNQNQHQPQRSQTTSSSQWVPGVLGRTSSSGTTQSNASKSLNNSPTVSTNANGRSRSGASIDGLGELYDSTSKNNFGSNFYSTTASNLSQHAASQVSPNSAYQARAYGSSNVSTSDSPASTESHPGHISSSGTSPEPSLNSPSIGKPSDISTDKNNNKTATSSTTMQNGEKSFCEKLARACGSAENPVPAAMSDSNERSSFSGEQHKCTNCSNNNNNNNHTPTTTGTNFASTTTDSNTFNTDPLFPGIDWFAQQNGGQFDPELFGSYRDPQQSILEQELDFGSFFNDAYPFPDMPSPGNFGEFGNSPTATGAGAGAAAAAAAPHKKSLMEQVDHTVETGEEEVVPGEDRSKMMTCTKIWDRLQSMEKFRNGELDVDHLCTELRTKARCSEGGVVLDQKDVEDIMSRAK